MSLLRWTLLGPWALSAAACATDPLDAPKQPPTDSGASSEVDASELPSPDSGAGPDAGGEDAASPQPHAPPWRVIELSFDAAESFANPFLDVDLQVDFRSPDRRHSIVRPAFWAGANIWKVRFAPEQEGLWTYTTIGTTSSGSGLGLLGLSGVVRGDPVDATLPEVYRKGFVRPPLGREGHHLVYANGEPFFWLSDVHWLLAWEPFDSTNFPMSRCVNNGTHECCRVRSTFKCMVDRRVRQGFTAYQTTLFGSINGWVPDAVGTRIDPEYFNDTIDPRMAYIADHGLTNFFGIGFSTDIREKTALLRLARYVVARYGAYPVVWGGGIEVDNPFACNPSPCAPGQVDQNLQDWRQIMTEISNLDRKGHAHPATAMYWAPLTRDSQPLGDFQSFFFSDSWNDFESLQSGHRSQTERTMYYRRFWKTPAKPFMDTELNFEQIGNEGYRVSREWTRKTILRALQGGAFAAGYGANGIWGMTVDDSYTRWDADWGHTNWYDAIDFEGANDMSRIKSFYQALPWTKLLPIDDAQWVSYGGDHALAEHDRPMVKAGFESSGISAIVVYYPAAPACPVIVHQVVPGQYQARWFDPRTGAYSSMGTGALSVGASGDASLPAAPTAAEDWLLQVLADEKPGSGAGAEHGKAKSRVEAGSAAQ